MFRSVSMEHIQILVPIVVAEEFVDGVGRKGFLQFTDLNEDVQPFNRKYTPDILRIQDAEKQIADLEDYLEEYDIRFDSDVMGSELIAEPRTRDPQIVERLCQEINSQFIGIREQVSAERQLHEDFIRQEDIIKVLDQLDSLVGSDLASEQKEIVNEAYKEKQAQAEELATGGPERETPLLRDQDDVASGRVFSGSSRDVGFRYFAGVVTVRQRVSFERQVFLTSRGNSFVIFNEDDNDDRIAFVVFYLGEQLKRSLTRLCQFMNIPIGYESEQDESTTQLLEVALQRKAEFKRILDATKRQLVESMFHVRGALRRWKISLKQEKAIRIALNRCRPHRSNTVLRMEGWCPETAVPEVQNILDNAMRGKGAGQAALSVTDPRGPYPTHFETNEFTTTFQSLVNTYGIPRYQEFNPAVPTIVTFPFLFGVMYGDVFHGSCLFVSASMFFLFDSKFRGQKVGEMAASMYEARYLLLFMGFFAVFCGLMYNDCMSIAIHGFNGNTWALYQNPDNQVFIGKKSDVYWFGVDPGWHGVSNELSYGNSLKMKLSVILGVSQMTFGLFCKLLNHIHERDFISIFWEFIPQFVFMMVFFGYMIFMIFYKWTINFQFRGQRPPSLIQTLISMILGVGKLQDNTPLFVDPKLQEQIQQIFVIVMVACIPLMLLPKPLLLLRYHNRLEQEQAFGALAHNYERVEDDDHGIEMEFRGDDESSVSASSMGGHGGHGHDDEEFVFSEVMIHQMIHTIEYVLGTVSNTASYLRLWALSLAHAELSIVFFDKSIRGMINKPSIVNVIMLMVATGAFFCVTAGVLLIMDVLECFLHALRLHWVEFQNKFYYADGVDFQPFSYKTFDQRD